MKDINSNQLIYSIRRYFVNEQNGILKSYHVAFLCLLVYSIALTFMTDNIGFRGDDWTVLRIPYWYNFPESFNIYLHEFSERPIQGLYWIVMFEFFGFNQRVFSLFSLILLTFASLLLGAVLNKAFPDRGTLAASGVLFAFFIPTLSSLTYRMVSDNSRLSLLFFWGSVLAFQYWATKNQSWRGLIPPVFLYYFSTQAYEDSILISIVIPLFVWPVYVKHRKLNVHNSPFFFRLCVGIIVGLLLFVVTRIFLFTGLKTVRHIIPPLSVVWSYIYMPWLYVLEPLRIVSFDVWTVTTHIVIILIVALILFRSNDSTEKLCNNNTKRIGNLYIAILGISVFSLGVLPFLIAGYGAGFGFTANSRVFSSASFGLAILLSLLTTVPKRGKLLFISKLSGAIIIGFMAMFHMDLRKDWVQAFKMNCNLWQSMLNQAPEVVSKTTFLFLNLQSYIGNRAVIVEGTSGIGEFIRMLYQKSDLNAYFIYPYSTEFVDTEGRLAIVSSTGVFARGSPHNNPIPLNNLLLFHRQGSNLILLDEISDIEHLAAITWVDVSKIRSNKGLIVSSDDSLRRMHRVGYLCIE